MASYSSLLDTEDDLERCSLQTKINTTKTTKKSNYGSLKVENKSIPSNVGVRCLFTTLTPMPTHDS